MAIEKIIFLKHFLTYVQIIAQITQVFDTYYAITKK